MRSLIAAVALAVSAATAFTGTAHAAIADDCVGDLLRSSAPTIEVVYVDDYGRVVIDPHGADGFVAAITSQASGFASCVRTCAIQFLTVAGPAPQIVYVDEYGRVVIDPNAAVAVATNTVASSVAFVNCVL